MLFKENHTELNTNPPPLVNNQFILVTVTAFSCTPFSFVGLPHPLRL